LIIRKEIIRKEIIRKEIIRNEIIRNEIIRKEIIRQEMWDNLHITQNNRFKISIELQTFKNCWNINAAKHQLAQNINYMKY
jgi:hypothetical protein